VDSNPTASKPVWQKTPYANLVRYEPSGKYFARIRVRGKLIRRCLKTTKISVAKLRLADLEKEERQLADHATAFEAGTMTFADALATFRQRFEGDKSLKPRTRAHRSERIAVLLKTWPGIETMDVRRILENRSSRA
jgi:hypothetical protein